MAESNDQKKNPGEGDVDLSGLSSMSLGPDWGSGKQSRPQLPRDKSGGDRPRRGPPGNKDRRGSSFKKGPKRGQRPNRTERPQHEPFEPVVAVDFYPEEEPFRVLSQAIRTSCRTFELFEIARLILEKPDRFVCVVRDPEQKEGEPAKLYASVQDGLPFRTEEEALNHTIRHYIGEFFDTETVEVDPPSGSFQVVHKCGMTGELLAPPNYHRYQAICREHHASKLAHVPYSKFEQRIESSREEADVQQWLDQMRKQTKYTAKENTELTFTSLEDARLYLVTNAREKLVRPAYSARFSGKALALLNPGDDIRRSVEYMLEGQRRFPLDTANHLRGRLRRMNFAVYKKGSKGISYVCAVKRRFRKPEEVLADNLQELIDFIEAHPNFPLKELPKAFLGIEPGGEKKPEDTPPSEAAREVAEEVAEEMGKPVEEAVPEAAPSQPETKAEPAGPSEKDLAALRQLKNDLHYLVSEGYVIEYSDGRLFVPPIREEEIRHVEKKKEAAQMKPPGAEGDSAPDKQEATTEASSGADSAKETTEAAPEPKSEPEAETPESEPTVPESGDPQPPVEPEEPEKKAEPETKPEEAVEEPQPEPDEREPRKPDSPQS